MVAGVKKCLLVCLMAAALSGCIIGRHVDWATRLVINGCVRDMNTNKPLSGVSVRLESERLVGSDRIKELSKSADDGEIHGEYERKWGCYQNALGIWLNRRPKVELNVHLSKERYRPVEIAFRLDKFSNMGGDVPINLGTVLLKPLGQKE